MAINIFIPETLLSFFMLALIQGSSSILTLRLKL